MTKLFLLIITTVSIQLLNYGAATVSHELPYKIELAAKLNRAVVLNNFEVEFLLNHKNLQQVDIAAPQPSILASFGLAPQQAALVEYYANNNSNEKQQFNLLQQAAAGPIPQALTKFNETISNLSSDKSLYYKQWLDLRDALKNNNLVEVTALIKILSPIAEHLILDLENPKPMLIWAEDDSERVECIEFSFDEELIVALLKIDMELILPNDSLLHLAALKNYKTLINAFANIETINITDEKGQTPIFYALHDIDILKLLISKGANINHKDREHETVLHYAIKLGYGHIIKELLEHKIKINAHAWELAEQQFEIWKERAQVGLSPWQILKSYCKQNTRKELDAIDYRLQQLQLAERQKLGAELIDVIIENGCDLKIISDLLEQHADLQVVDNDGNSAIHLAVIFGNLELTNLLLKYGAKPNFKNLDGLSALELAQNFGNAEIVEAFKTSIKL